MSIIHYGLITLFPVKKEGGAWLVINGLLRSSTQTPSCKCALSLSLPPTLSSLPLTMFEGLGLEHIKAFGRLVENTSVAHSAAHRQRRRDSNTHTHIYAGKNNRPRLLAPAEEDAVT